MTVRESARKVCKFIFCVIVLIDDEFYLSSSFGARILFVDVDDRVKTVLCRQDFSSKRSRIKFLAPNGPRNFVMYPTIQSRLLSNV